MKKISLGEVAKFINGRAFSPDEWGTIGLPIIRIQNLTGSSLLTNYYCGEFEKINQHIFKVVPKESVDKLYFYYAASNALNEMISQVHGSTMQHITKDPFESTLIYLPSLSEQKRIAAILEKADRLRRQRRYALELSDTYLQTVFLEMFGDPVTNPKGWIQEHLGEKITYITSGSRGWA